MFSFFAFQMFVYWQWSWTRLLLKSRAEVGVLSLSRAGHLSAGTSAATARHKEPQGGFSASAFME